MPQWFIWFPEFADFTEFPFHVGTTSNIVDLPELLHEVQMEIHDLKLIIYIAEKVCTSYVTTLSKKSFWWQ